jgi:hypothetical protein
MIRRLGLWLILLSSIAWTLSSVNAQGPEEERVTAITPPAVPLPSEDESRNVSQFSFIAYGDTRGRRDGTAIQYEHSLLVDGMLAQIKRWQPRPFP